MMDLTSEAASAADARGDHRAAEPVLGDDPLPGRLVPGGGANGPRHPVRRGLGRSRQGAAGALGARHRRALLRDRALRHVEQCLRLDRQAHHRNGGRELPDRRPGWKGTPPADIKETFRSPTRFVWVNGQMQADGPTGLRGGERAAEAIQADAALRLGRALRARRPRCRLPPASTRRRRPLAQVQKMDAGAFFGRLARLMKDNPPAPADGPMVEKLKTLGIEPGKDFDIAQGRPGTPPRACSARWARSSCCRRA